MKKEIEILVRAVIRVKGKILVCRKIGKKYYFFPGGHLEFGESTKRALAREIKEELGLKIEKCNFIGVSEHQFVEEGIRRHEINLAFEVKLNKLEIQSKENHLRFFLKDKEELVKEKVLPESLKKAVLKWLKDKRPFWVNEIN